MNKLLLLPFFILLISCSSKNVYKSQVFCKNEFLLLGSFEDLPHLSKDITEVRDRGKTSLDSLWEAEGYFVEFKVNHTINEKNFALKMQSADIERYPGDPPPFNPYVNEMHVYLTKSDTLYIRREVSSLDSIRQEVLQRYKELKTDKFEFMYFNLYWDQGTDSKKLNSVITEVINGYLEVANNFSSGHFKKNICQLDVIQIDSLSRLIPFKLSTDFMGSEKYDKWDFIPWYPN